MKPRITAFDIETTNLRANFGRIIAACTVDIDEEEVKVFRGDDKAYRGKSPADDSKLVAAIKEELEDAWMWVGYNSKMFDIPFLNTRLNLTGQDAVDRRMHVDLLYFARRPNLCLNNARLDTVAKTFRLEEQKTQLNPEIWINAMLLSKDALDYVCEHCIQDVLVLKEVFPLLCKYIRTIHY